MRIAGKPLAKVKKKYAHTDSLVNWVVRDTKLLFELQNTSSSFVEKLAIMEQLILTKPNNLPTDIQQQVLDYIEFLLTKQESRLAVKQAQKEGKSSVPPDGKRIPERLRIAMQYKGTAPYPNVPVSKNDWFEQNP